MSLEWLCRLVGVLDGIRVLLPTPTLVVVCIEILQAGVCLGGIELILL